MTDKINYKKLLKELSLLMDKDGWIENTQTEGKHPEFLPGNVVVEVEYHNRCRVIGEVSDWSDSWVKEGTTHITKYRILAPLTPKKKNPWIKWKGGECPVEKGTLVDVKYRKGIINKGVSAGLAYNEPGFKRGTSVDYSARYWGNDSRATDIIAYRLHKPKKIKAKKIKQLGLSDD